MRPIYATASARRARGDGVEHPLLRDRHLGPQVLGEQTDPELLEQPADLLDRFRQAAGRGELAQLPRRRPRSARSRRTRRALATGWRAARPSAAGRHRDSAGDRSGARTAWRTGSRRRPGCCVCSAMSSAAAASIRTAAGQLDQHLLVQSEDLRAQAGDGAHQVRVVDPDGVAEPREGCLGRGPGPRRRLDGSSSPTEASRASASRAGTPAYGAVRQRQLVDVAQVGDDPPGGIRRTEQDQPSDARRRGCASGDPASRTPADRRSDLRRPGRVADQSRPARVSSSWSGDDAEHPGRRARFGPARRRPGSGCRGPAPRGRSFSRVRSRPGLAVEPSPAVITNRTCRWRGTSAGSPVVGPAAR